MKTITRTKAKELIKEKINDSLQMILIDVESFEYGEFTPYELVEKIKEEINKINKLIKQ